MPAADPTLLNDPRRLQTLHHLGLLDAPPLPALERLVRLTARVLNVPAAAVTLVDAERQFFTSQVGFGEPWASERQTPLSHSICQHVVAAKAPLEIDDTRRLPLTADSPGVTELGIIAYAGMPLTLSDGSTVGTLCAIDHQPRVWTAEEIELLEELSASALTGLELLSELAERRRVEEIQREQQANQFTLRRIETELSRFLTLDDVLSAAMDPLLRISGATDGYIGLIEDDLIRVAYHAGRYERGMEFFIEEGIVGRAVRTRRQELVQDVRRDPDDVPYLAETRARMVFPLVHRVNLIGVINLETAHPERFTPATFEFMRMIVSRITIAIENARLFDLTQRQLAEMNEIYKRVSALEQLKTDMIRIAAHDLRNPLGSIIGFAQLQLEDRQSMTDDQADYAQIILRAGYKMEKIITDILSLERVEEMQHGAPRERIDLAEIIRLSAEDMRPLAQAKSLTLAVDVGDGALYVSGDGPQLREAVDNLISNAIKYTPEHGSVMVRLRAINDRAVLEVEDNGIGIPEALQEKLFSPFFRAKTDETRHIEGTGLGLHLVKNIIDRHDGRLRFHSTYGEGSMFGFDLPVNRQAP